MTLQSPWFDPDEDVHHVCTNCPEGQKIPVDERTYGDGARIRCPICIQLINKGQC